MHCSNLSIALSHQLNKYLLTKVKWRKWASGLLTLRTKRLYPVPPLAMAFIISTPMNAASIQATECTFGISSQSSSQKEITLIKPRSYQSKAALKLGFNLELGQVKGGIIGDYTNPLLVEMIDKLKVDSLRYPGGTPSNYFNWDKEVLDESLVKKWANKNILSLLKRLKRENQGDSPKVSLNSFTALVNERNISPFIVLNIFLPDDHIKRAIDKVKRGIRNKVYWELGNEIAYDTYSKKVTLSDGRQWSSDAYKRKIHEISQYIKSRYPLDEIGVVVSDLAMWRVPLSVSTWKTETWRKAWDRNVNLESNVIDAVIVHPYVLANNNMLKNILAPCQKKARQHSQDAEISWVLSNAFKLPDIYMERLNSRFPGKKIWLTEFSVMSDSGNNIEERRKKHRGLRTLSLAGYYVSWLKKYPVTQTILMQQMSKGYGWGHVLFPDLSYTSNGVAYFFIKEFMDKVTEFSNASFDENISFIGFDRYSGIKIELLTGLVGQSYNGNGHSILLVNTSDSEVSLQLPWRAKLNMDVSFEWGSIIEPGMFRRKSDYNFTEMDSNHIEVKPRSISLITTH